ncbi:MAG TPA: FAD-dependent oxidoreductase [Candidatus Nanopelagicales bacterium]|jgi:3-phenylpropionate/trans-cinnamate dioxygenase ferredoxin reductase subunit
MTTTVVAVGAGQASAVAARTLRRRGFDGRIVLVGEEAHRPYQRPPLSKEYLRGGEDDDLYLLPEQWCAAKDVEVVLGTRVTRLVPTSRTVELADGRELTADAVLLATGGRARRLPGATGDRVCYLRTLDDAERISALIRPGGQVVVIGGGFIGSEVAASARARGADVTMIEMLDVPLLRVLGVELGAVCAEIHRRGGVDMRLGQSVESVTQRGERVEVRTGAGDVIEGDLVVVGVGIEPNVELAEQAGLTVGNGIVVDEHLRTSIPGIYAAGDVANVRHPLFGSLRVEHFDNASKQGAVAANNIMGRETVFDDPYWFWSDQYDLNLQYTGHATSWDEIVVRGSTEELSFVAFYLRDGIVRAAFGVERGDDVAIAKELVAQRATPDPLQLADPDIDLYDLVPTG